MLFSQRIKASAKAGGVHLLASLVVALLVAALVFGLWYPYPYGEFAGGRDLFILLVAVDVVCGPLLTMVIFNPQKPRTELLRDVGFVVVLQLAALVYGLGSVSLARPVFLAFEGDRFRVVSVADIDSKRLADAPPNLQKLGFFGPRLLGVHLALAGDSNYLSSIRAAMEGVHPSFRPERWLNYDDVRKTVAAQAQELQSLYTRYPQRRAEIDEVVKASGQPATSLGYYPIATYKPSDWVVIVDRALGEPQGYLPLDGWQ